MRVYKYPLQTVLWQEIEMPAGSVILSMQVQNEIPCIWALVNPHLEETEKRIFKVHVTGFDFIDPHSSYIGTFQNGDFVGHVFEITQP